MKTYIDNSLVRQRSKTLIQRLVHLRSIALEKATASYPTKSETALFLLRKSEPTADEERVAGKDGLAGAILHVVTDAVLRVARRVHGLDRNVANLEHLFVLGRLRDALAVLAADDAELGVAEGVELYLVSKMFRISVVGVLLPASCCRQRDPSDYSPR